MTGPIAAPTVELVLVVPREAVPGGCDFRGLRPADDAVLAELRAAVFHHGRFLERPIAEDDPRHKQLIPYVLVRDGEAIFLMQRTDAGGDRRLHGKASIGVGGHLNPVDDPVGELAGVRSDPLLAGLRREWQEELDAPWEPEFHLAGLLNDDTNAVGAVHLGVVFSVEARGRPLAVREADKLAGSFVAPAAVAEAWDRLETWSQLVASGLLEIGPGTG